MPLPDLPAEISVPARLIEVRRLAEHLRKVCRASGVSEMTAFDCELALVEAANNVAEHGHAGLAEGEMTLSVQIGEGRLRMELRDSGKPVPEGQFLAPATASRDAPRGRGIGIIRSCLDTVDYIREDGINRLIMIKRLD
ncbi:ATP-binding protein [Novosphingobium beihaiensis]|uniref:ATP-binding protein n=1 Tax=Novosphingobium beihaiensis TaxID=2930389 RepID=A0ABT0BSU6_9SPHN|nr:ATP-binding protein [Novosphingobium beihaiensis]MCJ2188117.1 ATP-binding protein [Novosphingobium beihaiensis]